MTVSKAELLDINRRLQEALTHLRAQNQALHEQLAMCRQKTEQDQAQLKSLREDLETLSARYKILSKRYRMLARYMRRVQRYLTRLRIWLSMFQPKK